MIVAAALAAIRSHAAAAHPNEACGLLLGDGRVITRAQPAANVHPTPETHFEIEPQALIDAYRAEREGGPILLGYFHSHPSGAAAPSAVDAAMSPRDGRVWAIASPREVRLWRDDPAGFVALGFEVVEHWPIAAD